MRGFLERRKLLKEFQEGYEALDLALMRFRRDFKVIRGRFDAVDRVAEVLASSSDDDVLRVERSTLFESRKGDRVSERTGTSSGRTYGGVRVGPVGVGRSSGSTSSSRTVTYAAPDVMAEIDRGAVVITTRRLGFVGTQFTRSVEFGKALEIRVVHDRLTVSPTSGSKVWQVRVPESECHLVGGVVELALAAPARRLDVSSWTGVRPDWLGRKREEWLEDAARTIAMREQDAHDHHRRLMDLVREHPQVTFPEFEFALEYEVDDELRDRIEAARG